MTRSVQLVNTSNWNNEPCEVEVVVDGKVQHTETLQSTQYTQPISLPSGQKVTITVTPIEHAERSHAFRDEFGRQLLPGVTVSMNLPHGVEE